MEEILHIIAAEGLRELALLCRFDSLSNRFEIQRMRHDDDRLGQQLVSWFRCNFLNARPVYLQIAYVKAPQTGFSYLVSAINSCGNCSGKRAMLSMTVYCLPKMSVT